MYSTITQTKHRQKETMLSLLKPIAIPHYTSDYLFVSIRCIHIAQGTLQMCTSPMSTRLHTVQLFCVVMVVIPTLP